MNFDDYLFRCSMLSTIMASPTSSKLPVGAMTQCKLIFNSKRWNREPKEIKSKYMDKGNAKEPDALTLLARVKKQYLKQNELRITNRFLSGKPDAYIGESIFKVKHGFDTKCPYTWQTMPNAMDEISSEYEWQDHGYIALTGAEDWTTFYALVNSPYFTIEHEKRQLIFKNNWSEFDEEYIAKAKEIEREHIVDYAQFKKDHPGADLLHTPDEWVYDIPFEERYVEQVVKRDNAKIEQAYERIKLCRSYMNSLK